MRCYGWAEAVKRDACVGSLRSYAVSRSFDWGRFGFSLDSAKRGARTVLADQIQNGRKSKLWTPTKCGSNIDIRKIFAVTNCHNFSTQKENYR